MQRDRSHKKGGIHFVARANHKRAICHFVKPCKIFDQNFRALAFIGDVKIYQNFDIGLIDLDDPKQSITDSFF